MAILPRAETDHEMTEFDLETDQRIAWSERLGKLKEG